MGIIRRRGDYKGETPEISHKELVDNAFRWLRFTQGCSVAFKERVGNSTEQPDAIGFRGGFSWLIECKASRSDFLADKKKVFRQQPAYGMGYYRFFMAPVGMLKVSEMPEGWGLLEVYDKARKYRKIVEAKPGDTFHPRNESEEISYLVSAIRRIEISMAVFVEPQK